VRGQVPICVEEVKLLYIVLVPEVHSKKMLGGGHLPPTNFDLICKMTGKALLSIIVYEESIRIGDI
jgi:hypothetical protein